MDKRFNGVFACRHAPFQAHRVGCSFRGASDGGVRAARCCLSVYFIGNLSR
jgi:hypothetical protein